MSISLSVFLNTFKMVQQKVNIIKKFNNKEKREKKTRWGFCIKKFVEFCKRTDLHGFKYIVMEDLNVIERSVWAVAVCVSFVCAVFFVITAYKWYARNPIVTVIESTQGAIWDVPFPAVTVCDINVISRRAARAFSNNLTLPENVTSDFVFKTLKFVPLLHSINFANNKQKNDLHVLQDILDLNNIGIESVFERLSPAYSCNNLVERCMWKTTVYRCEQLFQRISMALSLCCTFNYYAVNDETALVIKTYLPSSNSGMLRLPTPRRVASCGYQTALTILLRVDPSDYYSLDVASQGLMVFIDDAYNWPDLDSPVRLVNPSTEVLIALSPERTYSTSGIKSFRPEQRQCYYSDEIKIANFYQYSFHNCVALEKIEIIKKYCDCVPSYFPQKDYHRLCNFHDIDCLEHVMRTIVSGRKTEDDNILPFKCLPECEHYDYPLEVAIGKLVNDTSLSGLPFYENVNLKNRSVLNVFFNDLVSTRYRRDVYLNWQNILAAFGGLLSLMLGFTLISGFDFILFFILQVAYDCILRMYPKKMIANNKNIIKVQETNKFRDNSKVSIKDNKNNKNNLQLRF